MNSPPLPPHDCTAQGDTLNRHPYPYHHHSHIGAARNHLSQSILSCLEYFRDKPLLCSEAETVEGYTRRFLAQKEHYGWTLVPLPHLHYGAGLAWDVHCVQLSGPVTSWVHTTPNWNLPTAL